MNDFTNIDWAHEYRAGQLDLTCCWEMTESEYNPEARRFSEGQQLAERYMDHTEWHAHAWSMHGLSRYSGHGLRF